MPTQLQLRGVVCRAPGMARAHMVCRADTITPVFEICAESVAASLALTPPFQSRNDVEEMGLALPGHIRGGQSGNGVGDRRFPSRSKLRCS
jgi:hypothetical protein